MPPASAEVTPQKAEAQYSKAAKAELAKDYDRAFRQYAEAARQFLWLSRQATEGRLRAHYGSQAGKALERAERIKAVIGNIRPVAQDEFSEGEQLYVLQKSSRVNQGYFPLWESSEKPSPSSEQPPLSSEQRQHGALWTRPHAERYRVYSDGDPVLHPQDIVQHVVSDCSVCGAVVVCIDHHGRFGSKMLANSLYPQDNTGAPRWSDSGQYQFRVLYNGSYRRISIDDQLPADPGGTLMCMSTGDKRQLWPSLVEKAYMKLAGGYDFIGSDSSTDLHALAGWIPEHVDIRSSAFQPEKTWSRLAEGYHAGDCVLTLGTGERVAETGLPVSLLPVHCYAVVGVRNDDQRRLTIFDPWVQTRSGTENEELPASDGRVFEISWDEACNLFDGVYLSWNPELFKHRLTFHGMWKRDGVKGSDTGKDFYNVEVYELTVVPKAPHFRGQLRLDTGGNGDNTVWLQLTRHIRSHRSSAEYISLNAQCGSGVGSGFGRDVPSTRGQYTNAPHVLLRTSPSPDDVLTLIASYEGDYEDVCFTVTAYSNTKASWVPAPAKPSYSKDIDGAFTHKSAGGNHTYPSYYLNPQYHLRIHPRTGVPPRGARDTKTDLTLSLRGDRQIPMNLTLAWSKGERINELGNNDLALSSGPYSYGYALASSRHGVSPGDYTLVVSAFEPRHTGKFYLRVESSDNFEITPILQEDAGMFSKVVKGEWVRETAAGGPSFGKYSTNPAYELQVPATSQLKFRLQLANSHPTASLNLTIFNASTGATSSTHIATSGPYACTTSGVVISQTTFQPGKYLIIPSTYNPGIQAGFVLIVYSTTSGVQVVPAIRR